MPGWPLIKVISGGQTGADQAGLSAAKALNYETGGMAHRGYLTELGPAIWLKTDYGLVECAVTGYKPRTFWNVRESTGTVLFGTLTGGTKLTESYCVGLKKPYKVNPTPAALRAWIYEYRIHTLNIAGNRESVSPGSYDEVLKLLLEGLLPF